MLELGVVALDEEGLGLRLEDEEAVELVEPAGL